MPRPVAPPSPLMEAVRRIEAEQAKAERRAKKKATEPEPAPAPKKTRAARSAARR
jgi:hypothetical protein